MDKEVIDLITKLAQLNLIEQVLLRCREAITLQLQCATARQKQEVEL